MTSLTVASNATDIAGAVGTIASVVVGAAAIYWTYRANVPRRKAEYAVEITPLLKSTVSDVTVYRGQQRLTHPHTMTLTLINVGHGEFEASHFNDRPVEFALGSRIVAKLAEETGGNRRVPPADFNDDTFFVRPHVIHRGQKITYKLLLDGPHPAVTPRHSLNGDLHPAPWPTRLVKRWLVGVFLLVVCVGALATWAAANAKAEARSTIEAVVREAYQRGLHDGQQLCRRLPDHCTSNPAPDAVGGLPTGVGSPR
ncbi:hypothetical protein [Streptomyces sp. NPDC056468]|uniref:hypothetical protein n=1 Tax=Streptomyces sp. NPDC056468 TaxID=3345830 RepID=UPI0036A722BF